MKSGLTNRAVYLTLFGMVPLMLGFFAASSFWIFIVYNAVLLIVILVDIRTTPTRDHFSVKRRHDPNLLMGIDNTIEIAMDSLCTHAIKATLRDMVPEGISDELVIARVVINPGKNTTVQYGIRPMRRGSLPFGDIHMKVTGILGLFEREYRYDASEEIRVYPNLSGMQRYRLLARHMEREAGSRKQRIQGIALDFRGLRDYNPDDAYRSINWNASARARKPITNLYDIERSQNIILALDTGRTMFDSYKGFSRLDDAIGSALIFARIVEDKGDNIGLAAFSSGMEIFLRPDKGVAHQSRILDAMYAIQPHYVERDWKAFAIHLGSKSGKRSLVCIFSTLPDVEGARELVEDLAALKKKHGVLFISPENPGACALAAGKPERVEDVYIRAAALRARQQRAAAAHILTASGIHVVSCHPDELINKVVSMYTGLRSRVGYI